MSNGIDVLQAQIAQLKRNQRRLALGYAGMGVLAVAALMTGATSQRSASFDVIDAQRINIKEPDGTLRLAISNRTLFPGYSSTTRSNRIRAPWQACCSSMMKARKTAG